MTHHESKLNGCLQIGLPANLMAVIPRPKLWHAVFWIAIVWVCMKWVFQETHRVEPILPIPKKIWQLWLHPIIRPKPALRDSSYTWIDLNPGWDYINAVIGYDSAETFVQKAFSHRQDILDAFTLANETIHKADLLRYLLLLEEGGVYPDLDTRCAKPIRDWIPPQYRDSTGLVLGLELNDYFKNHYDPDVPYIQLCQWTLMSRPNHPTIQKVVESVIRRLHGWDNEDVMEITGPGVFTEAVFESLSELSGRDNEVLREEVSEITEPYQIGDVLILPINAFGSGQLHSGSKKPEECDSFVVHGFAGSWRPEKGA